MLDICWGSVDGYGSFLATGTGTSDEISPVPTSFLRSTARGTRKRFTRCSSQANARRRRAAWGSGSGGRLGRRRHRAMGRSRRLERRRWEGRRRPGGGAVEEAPRRWWWRWEVREHTSFAQSVSIFLSSSAANSTFRRQQMSSNRMTP